jgi:hypothetical protein
MTNEDLVAHLQIIGLEMEVITAPSGAQYIVVRRYRIPGGPLVGRLCDLAVQWSTTVPFVMHPSVHVSPPLVPMGQQASQASPLGAGWQYLSRVLRVQPSPKAIVAHINTVLSQLAP